MASKQKDGRYRAKVKVGDKFVYVSAHTVKELEKEKERVRREYVDGYNTDSIAFSDIVVEWWEQIKRPTVRTTSTLTRLRSVINKWILPQIDDRKLAKAVRRPDLQAIINNAEGHVCHKHLSTIKLILSEVCIYAMEIGAMRANYAHNLIIPEDTRPQTDHRIALTDDQVANIFDHARGAPIEILLHLLYYYGLRVGEAEALLWSDVDFQKKIIYINKSKNDRGEIGSTKTAAGTRTVDMPEASEPFLRSIRGLPGATVVPQSCRTTKYREWIRILHECGYATHIEGRPDIYRSENYEFSFTFHTFRHTYVTALFDAGVDPLSASRIMGHSSYSVTADIYTAITEDRKKSNTDKINTFFNTRKKLP